MNKECLVLFKALPIVIKTKANIIEEILKLTIKNGYIFAPEIYANYSGAELKKIIKIVEDELILSARQCNQAFHKSWGKIKDAPIVQLFFEQILHYITTYGFESLGIYDKESVYIPCEELNIPELETDKIPLLVIRGYTKEEIKNKVMILLQSGIALKQETINNIIEILRIVEIEESEIAKVLNREIKIMLYDHFQIIPKNAIEFLRYLIYKNTGKTLLIKSDDVINEIRESNIDSFVYFNNYKNKYSLNGLAEIFYRFKPLFLAFKGKSSVNKIINKIRKLAVTYHRPIKKDYLNTVTSNMDNVDIDKLKEELENVNIFRRIRLAYALKYRTIDSNSIMYRIRNGKSYATNFNFDNKDKAELILDEIYKTIVNNDIKDKKIYLPENIEYTLPYTEKQFIGNIPAGTYVKTNADMLAGVYWENVKGNRIDLDLSMISLNEKFGWDSQYRNNERSILFSGDMTDAQKGATEVYYIAKQEKNIFLLCLNYYNYCATIDVPFKIFVAQEKVNNMHKNYLVNPNNIICNIPCIINKRQSIIGLVVVDKNESKYYAINTDIGKSISSRDNDYMEHARQYLLNFYENAILLRDVLQKSGAKIVNNKDECDIDLSYENIEKDTIINLLQGE